MTENNLDRPDGGIRPGAIAGGAILLVVGATLLLDQSGVISASFGQLIGPFVLITLGALTMVEKGGVVFAYRGRPVDGLRRTAHRRRGGSLAGLWLMGLGLWMLVSQIHLWGLDFHNSWPLIVILSGVIVLVRGIR
jgi:hypothetical protein